MKFFLTTLLLILTISLQSSFAQPTSKILTDANRKKILIRISNLLVNNYVDKKPDMLAVFF